MFLLRNKICEICVICGSLLFAVLGCDQSPRSASPEVVLYTSIDEPVARPVIEAFTKKTGIKVVLVTDTEANKSVGLAERLRAEKNRPRADVWWGNEPFHTIRLANEGLFQPYESPSAKDIPAAFKDSLHRWAGNGLRWRVIASTAQRISHVEDLINQDGVALARPTAGTTAGHVASLYVRWGDERADEFFRALRRRNVKVLGGNGPVATAVANGEARYGLTDNDDVRNVRKPTVMLDEVTAHADKDDSIGLPIPTTVALVANRPDSPAAKQLVDFLLSQSTEAMLQEAGFAADTVRRWHGTGFSLPDYMAIAEKMPDAVRRATEILDGKRE
jgi:iron(III) transport system substrate-binding protein